MANIDVLRPHLCDVKLATRAMYNDLGADGMKAWVSEYNLGDEAEYAKSFVIPSHCVLDLACGYGRIAIPLSEYGCRVYGLDLSPILIDAAKAEAQARKIAPEFSIGDMCHLPYEGTHFDRVICFWNSFCHIVDGAEQLNCLNEVYRVLIPGGFAVFLLGDPAHEYWRSRLVKAKGSRVVELDHVAGHRVPAFVHDQSTIAQLVGQSRFNRYELQMTQIYSRKWNVLKLYKD